MDHTQTSLEVNGALVKQIVDSKLIKDIMDRGDSYFAWLERKTGLSGPLASILAGTDFRSIDGLDDILMESSKEDIRQMYANEIGGSDEKDIRKVYKSVRGDCCCLEVVTYIGIAINDLVNLKEEDQTPEFVSKMLSNAKFDIYDEEDWDMNPENVAHYWKGRIEAILKREYEPNGNGGFFPYTKLGVGFDDRRTISLWQQMNDWIDIHTNEEGEWVDPV